MNEQEPKINLNLNGEAIEAKRENTTLYTFLGQLALYNHIFVVADVEEKNGFYIFNDHPVYGEMAEFMFSSDYPMHLNQRQVAECDLDAYERHVKSLCTDMTDGVPEGWE